jgi:hypothetical protein
LEHSAPAQRRQQSGKRSHFGESRQDGNSEYADNPIVFPDTDEIFLKFFLRIGFIREF